MSEFATPYLPEHQSPDNADGTKPGYNPSPEDKKTLQLVDRMYSRGKKFRKRYDTRWPDFYKMFRGKQWKEARPSYRHSAVLNIIFQTIESMVPTLTDSSPKIEYLPTNPQNFELADILNKVAENDWVHNDWLYVLTECLFDSHFYGTAFGHIGYDPEANLGLGNITFESKDIFYIFPDPNARDVNEKRTRCFQEAEPTSIEELKREYPDKAPYIMADVVDFAQGDKTDIYQTMFKSPTDTRLMIEGQSNFDSLAKNQALKITTYFKDDSYDEEEQLEMSEDREDNQGSPVVGNSAQGGAGAPEATVYVQKKKYPNGRKIITAGGVLLDDGEMDESGLFPFAKLTNYILPREFWGMGEVEQLEDPQKTLNKMISFSLDVMTLMGNPVWVVDSARSGIDTDNLFNKPGLVVETDDMEAVRREQGMEIPPTVLQMMDRYKQWMDGVSGENDLSRGAEPADITAASAIANLQQAQQTRLRLKSRNLDKFIQQIGTLYLHQVMQRYTVPRMMRITGKDNVDQYFTFHVESLAADPKTGEVFKGQDGQPTTKQFAITSGKNSTTGVVETKQYEMTTEFDVRVSTGSGLPYAKAEKFQQSKDLFDRGIVDDEEVLKNIEYPNYEAVLARMAQKRMQMAQMQAMNAQPPGGNPGNASSPAPTGGPSSQAA